MGDHLVRVFIYNEEVQEWWDLGGGITLTRWHEIKHLFSDDVCYFAWSMSATSPGEENK